MNEYEFIKYEDTQNDAHTKALITIRQNLYTKDGHRKSNLLVFGKKENKNGGVFWAMATHGINKGEKYHKGFRCDSTGDQEMLDAFILECAKNRAPPPQTSVFEKPSSMSEVAQDDALPF